MKIMVANVGSSSFKCKLFDMANEKVLARAQVERVGSDQAPVQWTDNTGTKHEATAPLKDYVACIQFVLDKFLDPKKGVLSSLNDLSAVGFKPVIAAGGITGCQFFDDRVMAAMEEYKDIIVPLHNEICIQAVKSFQKLLPKHPMMGLFETAFFQEWPEYARLYGIPWEWTEKYNIRRTMGHGASHCYVNRRLAEIKKCKPEDFNALQLHMGGSSSVIGVRKGVCIDGTAGFSMQCGMPHSIRNGDIDGYMITYLESKGEGTAKEIINRLMTEGGLHGISGMGFDMRDLQQAAEKGHKRARLAIETYVYQTRKYMGSFLLVLGHTDAITFAGGTGENSSYIRKRVLENLEEFGILLDEKKNEQAIGKEMKISRDDSKIEIWVIPTNEEIVVARACAKLLKETGRN